MKTRLTFAASCICTLISVSAFAADDIEDLVKKGKFSSEIRYRYEHVEQNNALRNAKAHTFRTNFGFETGSYRDFKAMLEGQLVQHFGDSDYNSFDNGRTTYSAIADPDTTQINQAWVSYSGLPETVVKAGRQGINLDNERFVGTVGWRQNDQTFDAVTVTNGSIENLTLQYGFIDNVNRIFTGSTPPDHLNSTVHLANIAYKFADWLKLTGYGYWMEFATTPSFSNRTFGLRATGQAPISEIWTFSYEAEYAGQEDYQNNPGNYDENYYHIAPSVSGAGFTLTAGYEVLEGNGTTGFQTPLATLHKFNGWADTFLTTPVNGLEDAYVSAGYKISGTESVFDGVNISAAYHDFDGEKTGDYGDEIDVSVGRKFILPDGGQPFKDVNVLVKYADYDADDTPYVDTEKFWVQVGLKF